MTINELIIHGGEALQDAVTLPFLDAEVLLAHLLEKNRAYIIAHGSDIISIEQERQYNNLIGRRAAGEPMAYLTGHKEFYGIDFEVDEAVLVPRPETERLIDEAQKLITTRYGTSERVRILDIGTGSGAIGLTLAKILDKQAQVIATDISSDSLAVAYENMKRIGVDVELLHGSVYEPLPEGIAQFDLIISNPPYLTLTEAEGSTVQSVGLRYEPEHALVAQDDGFAIIADIIQGATQWLLPYGSLLLEIGSHHAPRITAAVADTLPEHAVTIIQDFGNEDRFAIITPKK